MVTTRKTCDSKVITMDDKAGGASVPPKTLLEEVNPQLMCVLCRGYYIDATTIVECLHSFCRSCIIKHLQVRSYCPICEMMINSAKPNIKPDKALQDIVYKLVPGLFQREMQRRQAFYASHPGAGANATPEQRGEDTERIIFSPEDVISFSLEYMDCSEADNVSSKSSESGNESTPCNETGASTRRYLQCPAVVNISHLKKFLSMKYDVDATHFFVDILYKRVPLPDYYTLMDIAYIYNWKRVEPMRFFYQISDFTAIRDRFGFFRSDSLGGRKGKGDPGAPASPAPSQATEGGSDASSGSFSPLSHDKGHLDFPQEQDRHEDQSNLIDGSSQDSSNMDSQASPQSSSSVDVEKSQFLNSFELTAKNNVPTTPTKVSSSPAKEPQSVQEEKPVVVSSPPAQSPKKSALPQSVTVKTENQSSPSKRKLSNAEESESKKSKVTPEKNNKEIKVEVSGKELRSNDHPHTPRFTSSQPTVPALKLTVPNLHKTPIKPSQPVAESTFKSEEKVRSLMKSAVPTTPLLDPVKKLSLVNKSSLLKRKAEDSLSENPPAKAAVPSRELNKDVTQHQTQKMSDVKDSPTATHSVAKPMIPAKINMAPRIPNKSDASPRPPEVKKEIPKSTPLLSPRPLARMVAPKKQQGDPLKSLFDSCNINIPSSLSITLTDQKEQGDGNQSEGTDTNRKTNTSTSTTNTGPSTMNTSQKQQVHNYIEIVKIPEENAGKPPEDKNSKPPTTKPTEGTASTKGPVPNLKPIADVKVPITKPQTFQQTFLQSLQQQCEKPKYIKTRMDFPNKGPAPATATKGEEPQQADANQGVKATVPGSVPVSKYKPVPMAQPIRKPTPNVAQPKVTKSDSALDLSTPHVQSQLGPQQAKALETMQNIANLAKKQSFSQRMTSPSQVFSQDSFKMNTSNSSNSSAIRIPVPPQNKYLKPTSNTSQASACSPKHFPDYLSKNTNSNSSSSGSGSPAPTNKPPSQSTSQNQRSLTRSPSSSPKLVIACPSPKSQSPEDKHLISPRVDTSQSSLVSSTQISSTNHNSNIDSKETPKNTNKNQAPSKTSLANKSNNGNNSKATTSNNNHAQQLLQQAYLRQQLELQTQLGLLPPGAAAQWFNNPVARAHFENIMKNMTHTTQLPFSNNHNSKENK